FPIEEKSRKAAVILAAFVISFAMAGVLIAVFKAKAPEESEAVARVPGTRSLEGRVVGVETSGSGKSRYLVIESGGVKRFAGIRVGESGGALSREEMGSYVNRRIRVTGRPIREVRRGEVIIF